jgi:hypothetical protein
MDEERDADRPRCYAAELGDCDGKISREHYISRSVLELIGDGKSVTVSNLPFLEKDIPTDLGIKSLTAKVLCKHHNSILTDLDVAGVSMFRAMAAFTGATGEPAAPAETIRIDGDAFERWLLKLFCGSVFSGNIRFPDFGDRKGKSIPSDVTRVLYGKDNFRPYKGVYLHGASPVKPILTDGIVLKTSALHYSGVEVLVGVRVWLFGFQFDLVAFGVSFGMPAALKETSYRPAAILSPASNVRIEFTWADGPRSEDVVFEFLGERPASA